MQCRHMNIQGRAPIRLLIQFFFIIPQSLHTWCQIEIRMIPNEWQSHNYWCVDTVKHPLRITNKLHPTHIHIQRCTTNIQLNCSALATIWYTTTYVLILYFDWRLLYKLNKNDAWLKVGRQYSYMFNSILLTLDCHSGWMGWFQYWPGFHSNWNFFFYSHPTIEYATIQQHTERIMMTCSTLFISVLQMSCASIRHCCKFRMVYISTLWIVCNENDINISLQRADTQSAFEEQKNILTITMLKEI